MTDVLLTHSYFLRFDHKQWKTQQPYAPLGTLYAASVLGQSGIDVALFDSMLASSEDELASAIEERRPKIVAIYDDSFNYLTKMCLERMRLAAFRMISIAKHHGCIVVVSGPDAGDNAADYLSRGADFVIKGEGEFTLQELSSGLLNGNTFEPAEVKGLSFMRGDSLTNTPARGPIKELDVLPFPAWDLVDIEKYRNTWNRHGYFSMNVVTTRGCPFGCNWCAKPLYGRVYNSRTPANVAEEIEMLKDNYRPDHIWFCDDIFGLRPGWIEEFAKEVEGRQLDISYKCLSRPDLLLREDCFASLARSGCETVWMGAESGEQKILDAMEKGTTVEQIRLATRRLRRSGIRVGYFLQFGYPGEEYGMILKTLKLVREEMPDEIGVSVSYPMPGTKFFEMVKGSLGAKRNWYDSGDLAMLFPGEFEPRFYRILHGVIHRLHRLRRILGGYERLSARAAAAFVYHSVTLPIYLLAMRFVRRKNAGRVSFAQPGIRSK